jgi:hypothetical protein
MVQVEATRNASEVPWRSGKKIGETKGSHRDHQIEVRPNENGGKRIGITGNGKRGSEVQTTDERKRSSARKMLSW